MEEKGLLILAANSYFCVKAKLFQEADHVFSLLAFTAKRILERLEI